MENNGNFSNEMLVEILSRLPIKPLCRFKCVSKSWCSLIKQQFRSRIYPSHMLGFFYQMVDTEKDELCYTHKFHRLHDLQNPNSNNDSLSVDTTLGFLPLYPPEIIDGFLPLYFPEIMDSCNGLLLCRYKHWWLQYYSYYCVCNPATKRWDFLSPVFYNKHDLFRLAFDPDVSSHYNVVWVRHRDNYSEFRIFSSENHDDGWQKGISLQRSIGEGVYSRSTSVFRKGALYITSCGFSRYYIVRYRLLQRTCSTIMLPPGFTARPFISILAGSVCCSELVNHRLRIWTLVEHDNDDAMVQWALKHDIFLFQFGTATLMGSNPFSEVFFLETRQGFWSYNLEHSSTTKLVNDGPLVRGLVFVASIFTPFTPCYMGVLKHKGKTKMIKRIEHSLIFIFFPLIVLILLFRFILVCLGSPFIIILVELFG